MKEYWRGKCPADGINSLIRKTRVRCAIFHRKRANNKGGKQNHLQCTGHQHFAQQDSHYDESSASDIYST